MKGKSTFVKIQGDILWAERLKFCAGFGGFNLPEVDGRGGVWGCRDGEFGDAGMEFGDAGTGNLGMQGWGIWGCRGREFGDGEFGDAGMRSLGMQGWRVWDCRDGEFGDAEKGSLGMLEFCALSQPFLRASLQTRRVWQ